jgi:hypothetical protein
MFISSGMKFRNKNKFRYGVPVYTSPFRALLSTPFLKWLPLRTQTNLLYYFAVGGFGSFKHSAACLISCWQITSQPQGWIMTKPYRLSTTTPVLAYFQITEPIIPKPPTGQHKPAIFSSQFQNYFAKIHISAVHIVALTNDIFPKIFLHYNYALFCFPYASYVFTHSLHIVATIISIILAVVTAVIFWIVLKLCGGFWIHISLLPNPLLKKKNKKISRLIKFNFACQFNQNKWPLCDMNKLRISP